ncbi:MAG: hypothetical protein HPY44_02720 [Armatimonadetes bacterium]|nr:hypothetical protein [Armatimonadota bacterium]
MAEYPFAWLTDEVMDVWARHRRRFAALYAGEPVDGLIAIDGRMCGRSHGLWGTTEPDMLAEPRDWLADVFADMAANAHAAADPVTFRPLVLEMDAFGTHFIDALFGARVYFHEDQAWSEPLDCEVGDLEMPDLSHSPVLSAALELAALAVEASPEEIIIANPVLSAPVNIGINLFGQRLLEALVLDPDGAKRALGIITQVIGHCMEAFARVIPTERRGNSVACNRYAPPGYGFIDGCADQLVSEGHYAEFFAPLDARLLGIYPGGGMIHLCGACAQQIPVWREMPQVKSLQLNDRATEDLELYAEGRRGDQVLYVSPTETITPERAVEITGGRNLILQCTLPDSLRDWRPA